jgi:hypothetical protein
VLIADFSIADCGLHQLRIANFGLRIEWTINARLTRIGKDGHQPGQNSIILCFNPVFPVVPSPQSEIRNPQWKNPQSEIRNGKIRNPKSAIRNPESATEKFAIRNSQSAIDAIRNPQSAMSLYHVLQP